MIKLKDMGYSAHFVYVLKNVLLYYDKLEFSFLHLSVLLCVHSEVTISALKTVPEAWWLACLAVFVRSCFKQ